MALILVDSNVVLDIADEQSQWREWSIAQLEGLEDENKLAINPVIYAEVSIGYQTIEECEAFIDHCDFDVRSIPREALFLAGKAYLKYKRSERAGASVLPDFFIGAHAAVDGMKLLTRDKRRFRFYFPTVELITPKGH